MSKELIQHTGGERKTPWYRKPANIRFASFWTAAGLAITGVPAYFAYENVEAERRAQAFEGQLQDPVAQDGFKLLSAKHEADGGVKGSIQVAPNCIFDEVDMRVEHNSAGEITDVSAYALQTLTHATRQRTYNVVFQRYDETVSGDAATLNFSNQEDVAQNILRDNPCETMANNVRVIDGK